MSRTRLNSIVEIRKELWIQLTVGSDESDEGRLREKLAWQLVELWKEKGSNSSGIDCSYLKDELTMLHSNASPKERLAALLQCLYFLFRDHGNSEVSISDPKAGVTKVELMDRIAPTSSVESPIALALPTIRRRLKSLKHGQFKRHFVYGAGTHTVWLWDVLIEVFGEVNGVLDRDPNGAIFREMEVTSVNEANLGAGDAVILSSNLYESEMRRAIENRFSNVHVLELYAGNAWEDFECQCRENPPDRTLAFDRLHKAILASPEGRTLNAIGFPVVLYKYFMLSEGARSISPPCVPLPLGVTRTLKSVLMSEWDERIEKKIAAWRANGKLALVDYYSTGEYLETPVSNLLRTLLERGVVENVLVLVTETSSLEWVGELEKISNQVAIVPVELPAFCVNLFAEDETDAELYGKSRAFAIDRFTEGCDVFETLARDIRHEVLRVGIYKEWMDQAISRLAPSLFVNLQDNRILSRAYYLLDDDKRVPVVQMQHGTVSSSAGPLLQDVYIAWRDRHSQETCAKLLSNCSRVLPFGNYNLNVFKKRMHDRRSEHNGSWQRSITYFVQAPPYSLVTHQLTYLSLVILHEALSLRSERWTLKVKFRRPTGCGVYIDYFDRKNGAYTKEYLPHDRDNLTVFENSDIIYGISSSVLLEAMSFNRRVCSVESEDFRGIARYSDCGLDIGVRSSDELLRIMDEVELEGERRQPLEIIDESGFVDTTSEAVTIAAIRDLLI